MAQTRHEWVLRFSRSPEFLDVDPEAAISLDGRGHVIGMTHGGAQILARARGLDWRDTHLLIGQPVSSFLDMDVDSLGDLTRRRPTDDRMIFARDGNALFAHAIEPQFRNGTKFVRAELPAPIRQLGGDDPDIAALQAKATKLARTGLAILIQGETGTGKEHLARAIHEGSGLKGKFIAINCAAIPEQLIESELFGYLPGAFTGAAPKGRIGLIEQADGGTLFLDEIGDMPLLLQSRLLRVLAEKEVMPIGGAEPRKVTIRVISASHRPLLDLVRAGQFREDLFYRLNTALLRVPALRQRSDFDWIVERLLARHVPQNTALCISPVAMAALRAHPWPGNIRELDNALAVAAALSDHGTIELADLPETLSSSITATDDGERRTLFETLVACNWNVSEAARRLDLDRSTVHRQIKRYHLVQPH
jgi:sigma-54 dependent transcriptional regulator, acetoin dehydrogenase operon transcriptional activator AcoR